MAPPERWPQGIDDRQTSESPSFRERHLLRGGVGFVEVARHRADRDLHHLLRSGFVRRVVWKIELTHRLPKQWSSSFAREKTGHAASAKVAHPNTKDPIPHHAASPGIAKAIRRTRFAGQADRSPGVVTTQGIQSEPAGLGRKPTLPGTRECGVKFREILEPHFGGTNRKCKSMTP